MSYTKVNRHNLSTLLPSIKSGIANSLFISIDTEFTGLGEAKKTRVQNIEDRYLELKKVANSHSVIALGISLFTPLKTTEKLQETPNTSHNTPQETPAAKAASGSAYQVQNFQFSLLSLVDHTISPSSMSFLVEHGFDFNDQYRNGIPYLPGNELSDQERTATFKQRNLDCHVQFRDIVISILYRKCPVILHNGLLDLLFLYQSFYAQLPPTLPIFVADCSEMFLGGLYDTKYISDFITREPASFLALLFRKYQRQQQERKENGKEHVDIQFVAPLKHKPVKNGLRLHELGLAPKVPNASNSSKRKQSSSKHYCEQFANHGFCLDGKDCEKTHDLDVILDDIEGKPHKKAKLDPEQVVKKPQQETLELGNLFEQDHSACFDAFMTGYVFSHQTLVAEQDNILEAAKNKIYLIGKQIPLLIEKSRYAKQSSGHLLQKKKYC